MSETTAAPKTMTQPPAATKTRNKKTTTNNAQTHKSNIDKPAKAATLSQKTAKKKTKKNKSSNFSSSLSRFPKVVSVTLQEREAFVRAHNDDKEEAVTAHVHTDTTALTESSCSTSCAETNSHLEAISQDSAIHEACRGVDIDTLQALVQAGANVDACDESGNTPLLLALQMENWHLVRTLVELGANVNMVSSDGPVLLQLLKRRQYEMIPWLVEKGADVKKRGNHGETALHVLCRDVHAPVAVLHCLVDAGANVHAVITSDGTTPLMWALYYDNLEIAEELIKKGADLFATSTNGIAPYSLATSFFPHEWNKDRFLDYWSQLVQQADKARIRSLWSAVTDLEYAAKNTMSLACKLNVPRIVRMVLREDFPINEGLDSEGCTALHIAVMADADDVIDTLVTKGANLNCSNNHGWTPLHVTAQEGKLDIGRKLIANGANTDQLTNDGETALLIAVKSGRMEQVKCFVENGVNVNTFCLPQFTVLHLACYVGDAEIARYLLDHGANPELQSYEGYTALQYASERGHAETCELLIQAGADPSAKVADGRTALYMACSQDRLKVVKVLVRGGAEIDQASYNEYTALHCSCLLGQQDIVEVLLSNGADPSNLSPCGHSAMDLAIDRGHENILEMLLSWDLDTTLRQWQSMKTATLPSSTDCIIDRSRSRIQKNKLTDPGNSAASVETETSRTEASHSTGSNFSTMALSRSVLGDDNDGRIPSRVSIVEICN